MPCGAWSTAARLERDLLAAGQTVVRVLRRQRHKPLFAALSLVLSRLMPRAKLAQAMHDLGQPFCQPHLLSHFEC